MNKTILYIIIAIAAVIVTGSATVASFNMQESQPLDTGDSFSALPDTVNVGVLLPASGDLSSHGHDNQIAAKLALADFNDYLESIEADWRMNLVIEDTQTDPIVALEKIQSLNSKGIKVALGPETSAELRNIKSYADSNDMLLISPSSTSPKLAIDDNLFRLVPDDTKQGVVIAELLSHHNIKVAIPIYRADVWGDGVYTSSKESFEALGGLVDDGIRYSPEITVFSTEANLLSDTVNGYQDAGYAKDEIAVLMISFSEAVHLLNSADSYDNLHQVRWFGSDASSNDDALTSDKIASGFAQDVSFVSAQFSVSDNEKYDRVYDHLVSETGSSANNYAYSSYDSLWLLGLAIHDTQSTDAEKIKEVLPEIADSYVGAIGDISLNEAGDLARGDYELWHIHDGEWQSAGRYIAQTGTLEFN